MNIRPETIKLGENIGGKLVDVSLGHDFLKNPTPKAKATKAKKKQKLKKASLYYTKKVLYSKRSHKQNEKEI